MPNQEPDPTAEMVHRQKLALWIAMLGSIAMYFVIMRIVPSPAAEGSPALVTGLLAAAAVLVAVSFLLKSRLSGRAEPGASAQSQITATAIPLVLCEAAALFGVVVHFVTGSPSAPYFLVLGVFGMILHFPRRAG